MVVAFYLLHSAGVAALNIGSQEITGQSSAFFNSLAIYISDRCWSNTYTGKLSS